MPSSLEDALQRIDELERLVSAIRHDVNGALSPALLLADRLRMHDSPVVKTAAERISHSIVRASSLLKSSRNLVPSRREAAY